jgi:hypothetical protein
MSRQRCVDRVSLSRGNIYESMKREHDRRDRREKNNMTDRPDVPSGNVAGRFRASANPPSGAPSSSIANSNG